jgi:hypothetical protein
MHLKEDITHLLMAVMVVVKPFELQDVSMLNCLDKFTKWFLAIESTRP